MKSRIGCRRPRRRGAGRAGWLYTTLVAAMADPVHPPSLKAETPQVFFDAFYTLVGVLEAYGWPLLGAAIALFILWSYLRPFVTPVLSRLTGTAPKFETDAAYRARLDDERRRRYAALEQQQRDPALAAAADVAATAAPSAPAAPVRPVIARRTDDAPAPPRGGLNGWGGGATYRPSMSRCTPKGG